MFLIKISQNHVLFLTISLILSQSLIFITIVDLLMIRWSPVPLFLLRMVTWLFTCIITVILILGPEFLLDPFLDLFYNVLPVSVRAVGWWALAIV